MMTEKEVNELHDADDRLHEMDGWDGISKDVGIMIRRCSDAIFPSPIEEWCEEEGTVLWWRFPINEPPYVGSPIDSDWPGYHTHYTPIIIPREPTS